MYIAAIINNIAFSIIGLPMWLYLKYPCSIYTWVKKWYHRARCVMCVQGCYASTIFTHNFFCLLQHVVGEPNDESSAFNATDVLLSPPSSASQPRRHSSLSSPTDLSRLVHFHWVITLAVCFLLLQGHRHQHASQMTPCPWHHQLLPLSLLYPSSGHLQYRLVLICLQMRSVGVHWGL